VSTPYADHRLTEEQVLLRDTLRDLADARIAPRAAEIDRSGEFPEDIRRLLAEYDVLALPFPVEHGGVGGDLLTVCLAIEQIARACATSSLILIVQELGALPLLIAGTTTGMDVLWTIASHGDGWSDVTVVHTWDGPPWPGLRRIAAEWIIGPVFVSGIASRTLACLARAAERTG